MSDGMIYYCRKCKKFNLSYGLDITVSYRKILTINSKGKFSMRSSKQGEGDDLSYCYNCGGMDGKYYTLDHLNKKESKELWYLMGGRSTSEESPVDYYIDFTLLTPAEVLRVKELLKIEGGL